MLSWLKNMFVPRPPPEGVDEDLTDPEEHQRNREEVRVLDLQVAYYKLDPRDRPERRKHPR